jgi:hypothetical protein
MPHERRRAKREASTATGRVNRISGLTRPKVAFMLVSDNYGTDVAASDALVFRSEWSP